MTIGCQCKSGFFSLRDCEEPVAATCGACGRTVCARHLSPASGFTRCLDCQGREPANKESADSESDYGDDWVYGYRDNYYRSGYGPIYTGSYYNRYYDQYDTRSFASRSRSDDVEDDTDDDERAATGFGDS
jgi:hypothetical protein